MIFSLKYETHKHFANNHLNDAASTLSLCHCSDGPAELNRRKLTEQDALKMTLVSLQAAVCEVEAALKFYEEEK